MIYYIQVESRFAKICSLVKQFLLIFYPSQTMSGAVRVSEVKSRDCELLQKHQNQNNNQLLDELSTASFSF